MVSLGFIAAIMTAIGRLLQMHEFTRMDRVETYVVVTTLLLVIRLLLEFLEPVHRILALLPTIDALNYTMVHYTMGLMQLSAARVNDYFQVWAVLLVTLQYSVKVGRPYSRSKQIPLLDLMSSLWAANLIRVQATLILSTTLWLIWALNASRIILYFSYFEKAGAINQESTRIVTDYMSYEHELGVSRLSADVADPPCTGFTMDSYKYLVRGEDRVAMGIQKGHIPLQAQHEHSHRRRKYRIGLDPRVYREFVTVNQIWNIDGGESGLVGRTADPANRLKDVCLSFALYKLLRCRFYDLLPHDARLPEQKKVRRLVFEYILHDSERAFRVVATEISFLKDFFYSKHAAMFGTGFPTNYLMLSMLLLVAIGYVPYAVRYIPAMMDKLDHNTITHGVFVTNIIVWLIIIKELSEVHMYVFSRWTKVLLLCNYAKHRYLRHPLVETALRAVLFFTPRERWHEKMKIHQHNILISTLAVKTPIFNWGLQIKHPVSVKLEECTKQAIFESIKRLETNPERLGSYFSNAFGERDQPLHRQLLWAVELEAETHRILVWHIATCLCEIDLASDKAAMLRPSIMRPRPFVNKPKGSSTGSVEAAVWWEHYATSASLSNYCAYLVVEALVPDNGLVTSKVFDEVRREIISVTIDGSSGSLFKLRAMRDVFTRLMRTVDTPDEEEAGPLLGPTEEAPVKRDGDIGDIIKNSLTSKGAKLAKQLMEVYKDDKAGLWEKLAAFWTGFLLHLAASTRTSKHRTHLIRRPPELTTHLWALLSHAGFHGRTSHGQTILDPHDLRFDIETRWHTL